MSNFKQLIQNLFPILIFTVFSMQNQNISVVGIANNAKYGAVVVTSNSEVYYIHGLESWESTFIGKQVKVTGKLLIKKLKKTEEIEGRITSPDVKIIKKSNIELIR